MLFLITDKQKNKILDEYHSRLINIFTFGVCILFVVLIVSLFPTYLTMKTDREMLTDRIALLQSEIEAYKTESEKGDIKSMNDNISLINASTTAYTLEIYNDIKTIYQSMPNVRLVSITADTLNKNVSVVANIDSKATASALVDKLNASRYKGADLPYSVFSQNKNFIFSQNLNYE